MTSFPESPATLLARTMGKSMKAANEADQQVRGLSKTPENMRMQRLEELQKRRREHVLAYYDAKDELERISIFPESE